MIRKCNSFDRQLKDDIDQVTIARQFPYRMKGSYTRKPEGAYVSDIDYSAFVKINKGLLKRIVQILDRIRKDSNFTFVQLGCGQFEEFIVPWSIDTEGGCSYDQTTTKTWYMLLEPFIPPNVFVVGKEKLLGPTISIRTLIEVENLVKPFGEINWSEKDIKNGHKLVRGINYDLIEVMKTQSTVLEFIYCPWGTEIVSVDIGLDDRAYPKGIPQLMYKYYTDDFYEIFKSYQKRLQKEFADEYATILQSVELMVAVRCQVDMLLNIVKMVLYSKAEINSIADDLYDNFVELNIPYGDVDLVEITDILSRRINATVQDKCQYFRDRLRPEFVEEMDVRHDRGAAGKEHITHDAFQIRYGTPPLPLSE
jgi:hypothetical protein